MLLALLLLTVSADPEPSLEKLARVVREQAMRASPEPPVGIFVEAPTPALARAFASVLSADLSSQKLSPVVLEAANAAEAERLSRTRDLRTLIRVSLAVETRHLIARGDVLHTWVNFWSGATPTRSGPAAAIAANVDADPQALSLAALSSTPAMPPTAQALKLTLSVFAHLASPPAAIAIGDLDGDKRPEVAVLTDDDLQLFASDGRPLARYDLNALPPATRPTREPFGALAIAAGKITWLSGKRAHGESLTFTAGTLKPISASDELSLDGVTVRLIPGINALAAGPLPSPLTSTHSRAGVTLFVFANGTGAFSRNGPPSPPFLQASSAAVLADLDGDGSPELVATSARFLPETDEVRVLSIATAEAIAARAGSLSEGPVLWSSPTARGRILTSAAGDLDADGAEDVVLGAWLSDGTGELLVTHRVVP